MRASSRSTPIATGERSAIVLAMPSAVSCRSVFAHDAFHQAPVVRGPGVDELAGHVEEVRAPEPDEAGKPLRAAAAGNEAELDLGLTELRVLRSNADVAAHGELEAAAEAEAVDRRDERLVRGVHPRAELLDPAGRAALLGLSGRLAERRELLDVRAATNARSPAPRSTIARTPASWSSRSISASSSSSSGAESALTGGWSIVRTATSPSCSVEMNSATRRSPPVCPRTTARTARAARSCGTCRLRSSGSPRRSRSAPAATTSRSSARGSRAARRRSRSCLRGRRQTASGRSDHFSSGTAITAASATARVPHQRVLERDGRDPLAAGLDEVLRAVLDLDVAVRLDGDDVAGLEPAVVRPAIGALGRLVVRGRDPDAAHLELAHRLAVPRHETFRPAGANLDERRRDALLGAVAELLLLGELPLAAR